MKFVHTCIIGSDFVCSAIESTFQGYKVFGFCQSGQINVLPDSFRNKSHLLNILRHNAQLDFGSWPGRKKPTLWMIGHKSDSWRISDICRTFEYQMGKTSMINSILRVSRASQRMSICKEVLIISLHVSALKFYCLKGYELSKFNSF